MWCKTSVAQIQYRCLTAHFDALKIIFASYFVNGPPIVVCLEVQNNHIFWTMIVSNKFSLPTKKNKATSHELYYVVSRRYFHHQFYIETMPMNGESLLNIHLLLVNTYEYQLMTGKLLLMMCHNPLCTH